MKIDRSKVVKGAFRCLVREAGGPTSASFACRADQGRLSRYASPNEGMQAPIDVVADLEQDTENPIVTRALADLAGYVLVRKPAVRRKAVTVASLGALGKEAGEAMSALSKALSDGKVTRDELDTLGLRTQVREALEVLAEIDAGLLDIESGEGEA